MILYDLGYPTDAIEVVKDLYSNATTRIKTPYGPTQAIELQRGTIQGDSLSPFLFILYIEPLLRWLQADGKGYKLGVMAGSGMQIQARNQISSITFADDINILTGGHTGLIDLKHQTKKLDRYLIWGHLRANNTKTLATGALHGSQPDKPYDQDLLSMQLSAVRLKEQPVTFHPPRDPFAHLGVLLTMDLNFAPQLQATLKEVREMTNNLKVSYASTQQKVRIINTCIRPAITYILTVSPFTASELRLVDNLLSSAYKQAYKLPKSMSTAATREDRNKGGLGCHSIEVEHNTICIQRLTRSLNHPGPFGAISRALFNYQKHSIDALTAKTFPKLLRHTMRLRQLMAFTQSDLVLMKQHQTHSDLAEMNALASKMKDLIPQHDQWDKQLVQDLHLLHTAGITSIETMLTANRSHVRPVQDLAVIIGSRNTKPKHKKAWNRISHYITTGEARQNPDTITTTNIPHSARAVHRQVLQTMQRRWPTQTSKPSTIIHYISNIYHRNEAATNSARNALEVFIQGLQQKSSHHAGSSTRDDAQEAHRPKSQGKTGWQRWKDLHGMQPEEQQKHILPLVTSYIHNTERITDVMYVGTSTPHTVVKGQRKRSGPPALQAMVRWDAVFCPGWLIQLLAQVGYRPITCSVTNLEDLASADVRHPCEFCGKSGPAFTQDDKACATCDRRYHKTCLTKWYPFMPVSQDTTFHCPECRAQKWTADPARLPPELRIFRVTWSDTLEPLHVAQSMGTPAAVERLNSHLTAQGERLDNTHSAQSKKTKQPQKHWTAPLTTPVKKTSCTQ
eukprot:GHUV01013835.1.p1 GENE.GHUV01013835.1~~GHUV01013835.1.p1  ORF type:complete len:792 (+),score=93.90 GHUV01013835.1:76-2451(+)